MEKSQVAAAAHDAANFDFICIAVKLGISCLLETQSPLNNINLGCHLLPMKHFSAASL